VAQGGEAKVDDSNLPKIKEVKTKSHRHQSDASHPFLSGEEAIKAHESSGRLQVTLFASEEQFPELVKPVQMNWDTKGRLWVSAWMNYPQRHPDARRDKLRHL